MLVGGFRARRFERLLARHWQGLRRMATRLTGDPDAAEDLLQDLAERALPHRDEILALDNDPCAWLARMLYRLFVDRWRRSGPELDPEAEVEAQPAADARDLPDSESDRLLTRERLQAALERLPAGMRDVVLLHDVEGHTRVEIAATATATDTYVSNHLCGSDATDATQAVYVFAGADVTPDDVDGKDPEPVTTVGLTPDENGDENGDGSFTGTAAFLEPGVYTAAFTCNLEDDEPPEDASTPQRRQPDVPGRPQRRSRGRRDVGLRSAVIAPPGRDRSTTGGIEDPGSPE